MSSKTEPSISIRTFIRWLPDKASEPTSTVVLTSSNHRFVDIRIFLPTSLDEPYLPNEGGPMARLEWGFAGTSSSRLIPNPEKGKPPIAHSQWAHWIDSKTDDAVTDEGDMFPQPDGIHTLETGRMVNPATGLETDYEECWADYGAESTEIGDGKDGGDKGKRWSVVLILDDEANGVKGMVIRVGRWCQGIIKARGEISLERWQWVVEEGKAAKDGEWKRVAKLGRLFLPCSLTFMPEGITEDSKITYGDYQWRVEELFSW